MKNYFPTINILRAIAALMVCFFHFSRHSDPFGSLFPQGDWIPMIGEYGAQGVFIFFVISGFVIPLSMYKYNFKIQKFGRFMARRWVRIEIPYIASILVYMLSYYLFCVANNWPFEFSTARFIQHIFYVVPFTDDPWINVIYWTLAIEFQYYIVIGLIYPLLVHTNGWISTISLLLFVLSGILFDDHRFVFYYAPIFALGIMLFRIKKELIEPALGWIVMIILSASTFYLHGYEIGISTAITSLIIAFITIDKKIFNRAGEISYSLYLIHGVIGGNFLYFLSRHSVNYFTSWLLLISSILISILIAYLFWWLIEAPSQRLSKRIKI